MSKRAMYRRMESLFTPDFNLKNFLKQALKDKVHVTKYNNKAGFRVYKTDVSPNGKTEILTLDSDGNVFSKIIRLSSESSDSCLKRAVTYVKKAGAKPKTVLMNLFGVNIKNIHVNGGDVDNLTAVTAMSRPIQDAVMSKKLKICRVDKNTVRELVTKETNIDRTRITDAPFFDAKHKYAGSLQIIATKSPGVKI